MAICLVETKAIDIPTQSVLTSFHSYPSQQPWLFSGELETGRKLINTVYLISCYSYYIIAKVSKFETWNMWYDAYLDTRKTRQFHGWIMITLNKWNKMHHPSHPSLVKTKPITTTWIWPSTGKHFKNFILIWKPQHPPHSNYIAQIQRSSLSSTMVSPYKSFGVFFGENKTDINLDMANKGHGMWFKNLNLLQHLQHVDIIKFSNLLSALISQYAWITWTMKGFCEDRIYNKLELAILLQNP